MALEDFFTLTEMKNGLTNPARVEELLSVMKLESTCVMKTFSKTASHWFAVAITIAITENKDSLDHFVNLDGLQIFNCWIQETRKFCYSHSHYTDTGEELITAIISALKNLAIDFECSCSSGIMGTVKDLFDHKSSRIQEKARALFNSWKHRRNINMEGSNLGNKGSNCGKDVSVCAQVASSVSPDLEVNGPKIFTLKGNGDVENQGLDFVEDPNSLLFKPAVNGMKDRTSDALDATQETVVACEQRVDNDLSFGSSERSNDIELPCGTISIHEKSIDKAKVMDGLPNGVSFKEGVEPLISSNKLGLQSECIQSFVPFDLNEGYCPQELEYPNTLVSAPLSCLAVSRRPNEYEPVCVDGSSYSLKLRQDSLEIDLNKAEGGFDGVANTTITDQIPASSCLLSGDSSIEVSSRRSERINLDLNQVDVGDNNDDTPFSHGISDKSVCQPQDGHSVPSHAASSSRKSLSANLDLNKDLPLDVDTYNHQTCVGQSSSQIINSCGGLKQDDRVIWLMGEKLSGSFPHKGQSGTSLVGTGVSRQQGIMELPQVLAPNQLMGYNSFPMGTSTYPSALVRPGYISYPVDPIGDPEAPEITQRCPLPYPKPLDVLGFGPTGGGVNLNSSSVTVEGRTARELEGYKQGWMWSKSPFSSAGLGVKRKETDGGLDLSPFDYRHSISK